MFSKLKQTLHSAIMKMTSKYVLPNNHTLNLNPLLVEAGTKLWPVAISRSPNVIIQSIKLEIILFFIILFTPHKTWSPTYLWVRTALHSTVCDSMADRHAAMKKEKKERKCQPATSQMFRHTLFLLFVWNFAHFKKLERLKTSTIQYNTILYDKCGLINVK